MQNPEAWACSFQRVYGIDKEGGFYHEHPLEKPSLHVETEQIGIEDFVIRSLDLLKKNSSDLIAQIFPSKKRGRGV